MGTKLYVGNLNYNTNEASLRDLFSANGREVTSVSIIMDRETGRSRGFAFVEMATPEFAQQAMQELDGAELDGRSLRINEARERDSRGPGGPPRSFGGPRPGGGYGGGGGGYGGGGGGYGGGGGGGPRPYGGGGPGGPPRGNFGPPAPPGGERRGGRDRDRGGGRPAPDDDRGRRGGARRRGGDDGDDW